MKNVDNHVEVSIQVSGIGRVAFTTDHGWANSMSYNLDMVNLKDALSTIRSFIDSLSIVPAFNDASNEMYVSMAKCDLEYIIMSLELHGLTEESMKDMGEGSFLISVENALSISISLSDSYTVSFGG